MEKIKILYRRKADKQQGIGTMGILTFRLQKRQTIKDCQKTL